MHSLLKPFNARNPCWQPTRQVQYLHRNRLQTIRTTGNTVVVTELILEIPRARFPTPRSGRFNSRSERISSFQRLYHQHRSRIHGRNGIPSGVQSASAETSATIGLSGQKRAGRQVEIVSVTDLVSVDANATHNEGFIFWMCTSCLGHLGSARRNTIY